MATDFAARFYQGLAGGAAIGTAFEEARAAMQMQGGRALPPPGRGRRRLAAGRIPWRLHIRPGAEAVAGWSLPQAAGDPLFGLPALPPLDLPDKPYRYLDWYRREDAEVFFGRGQRDPGAVRPGDGAGQPAHRALLRPVGRGQVVAAGGRAAAAAGGQPRRPLRAPRPGAGAAGHAGRGAGRCARTLTWPRPGAGWKAQAGRPLLVVLDQMEELFTRPNPEQPDELAGFLAALASLFGDPAAGRKAG